MNNRVLSGILGLGFVALACSSAGGASSAGGPGSAGSTGSAAGSPNTSQLCEQQFDAMETKCPVGAASKDGNVEACKADQQDYEGIGCLTEFDSWLSCTATNASYDCETDTGCEASQNSYFTCQSQAVQRTGCVRLGPQDTLRCSDATKPYAFGCLATAPKSCVQVVTDGGGIWCCPQL